MNVKYVDTMSAETLRRAAAKLREVGPPAACLCVEWTDHWFDRSICPEPCGMMHDICVECGRPKGGCLVMDEARRPSPYDLAVADMLVERADAFEKWTRQGGGQARIIPHEFVAPFAVARAYLGE